MNLMRRVVAAKLPYGGAAPYQSTHSVDLPYGPYRGCSTLLHENESPYRTFGSLRLCVNHSGNCSQNQDNEITHDRLLVSKRSKGYSPTRAISSLIRSGPAPVVVYLATGALYPNA